MGRWVLLIGVVLLLAIGAVVLFQVLPSDGPQGNLAQQEKTQEGPAPGAKSRREDGTVEVGGVRRPGVDVPAGTGGTHANRAKPAGDSPFEYGTAPSIPEDANPQVASVAAAIREKRNPEQMSSLLKPQPFDRAAYKSNPQQYINTIEPGRVFHVLQPGDGVQALVKISPKYQEVVQRESVYLKVSAPIGAPVTFTSFDMGQFENQLSSITVVSNDDGVAQVSLTGTTGTINDINVMAGSPMASGNVAFIVNVKK